jgi:hypothetical protein
MAAIDPRNAEQTRYIASFVPTAEDKAEVAKAHKVVRCAAEEAKEA